MPARRAAQAVRNEFGRSTIASKPPALSSDVSFLLSEIVRTSFGAAFVGSRKSGATGAAAAIVREADGWAARSEAFRRLHLVGP